MANVSYAQEAKDQKPMPPAAPGTLAVTPPAVPVTDYLSLRSMGWQDLLGLLAIIIAIAAYLAAIRLVGIQRSQDLKEAREAEERKKKGEEPQTDDAREIKKKRDIEAKLVVITIPDMCLVFSGLFLVMFMFGDFFGFSKGQEWQLNWTIWLFGFAIIVLAFAHLAAWYRSTTILFGRLIPYWMESRKRSAPSAASGPPPAGAPQPENGPSEPPATPADTTQGKAGSGS